MSASAQQVAAAQEALGCRHSTRPFAVGASGYATCATHHHAMVTFGGAISGPIAIWTDRGCPVAAKVADAVVATGPDPATTAAKPRRGKHCGCAWCCANNAPDVTPGEGHRICSAQKDRESGQ